MKLAFINGSPKAKESTSESILLSLKTYLPEEYMITYYNFRKKQVDLNEIEQIAECNTLILAFPLYVDGIPSQLLSCLYQMEMYFKTNPNPNFTVYALVNCGFYEGKQACNALEMVENWCEKAGIIWGQGIGIGGGGMLSNLPGIPIGKGPLKNLGVALNTLANSIKNSSNSENVFTTPNIPRFVYKLGGDAGWRQKIKANGLTTKDLFRTIS